MDCSNADLVRLNLFWWTDCHQYIDRGDLPKQATLDESSACGSSRSNVLYLGDMSILTSDPLKLGRRAAWVAKRSKVYP